MIERDYLARVAGDLAAVGGVRAVVLDDGAERGIRALEFRTGGGLRFDLALMSFIERMTLRFDAAQMMGDDHSMQFWFGLSQAF